MTSTRKSAKFVALLAGSALVLAACATSEDPDAADAPDSAATEGAATSGADPSAPAAASDVTFTYAYEQEIESYNANTGATNATQNAIVLNQISRGFWYFGPDGSVVPDTDFGTYELLSEDPLTVEYTFAEDAVWSDGEAIDCDDAVLQWAASRPEFQGVPADEEAGTPAEPGFLAATTTGYENHGQPECADGDKTFTLTYDEPFADYIALYGYTSFVPAHIVEQNSGVEDIIAAAAAGDLAAMLPAAEFWNTGFNFNPGEWNNDLALSAGPYTVDNWQAGQSITLVANDQWWGTPGASSEIVIRFIPQDAQAQALQNGEIQAMDPQPSPDLLAQLEAIGDSVAYESVDLYTYEHWDFNYNGAFSDRNLREAFALCLPRETIVENLIRPLNPEAQVLNSRFSFPFEPEYEDVVADGYAGQSEQDIEAAAALLEANDAVGTQLRIGHTASSRRTAQVALITEACGPNGAGFDVQDAGDPGFFNSGAGLDTGQYEVAQFAWAGSPLVTGSSAIYVTGGGSNFGSYSNPEVDALTAQLNATLDSDEQVEILKQLDAILWEDLATIPGFAFPGTVATAEDAQGVEFNPTQAGLTWNAFEWARSAG